MKPTLLLRFAGVILGCLIGTSGYAASKRPNFVFFLVDDLGWADVG